MCRAVAAEFERRNGWSLRWESEKMPRRQSSQTPKQPQHVRRKSQTDLSSWRKGGTSDSEKSVQNQESANNDSQEGSLDQALSYLEKVQNRVALKKNSVLQKHLDAVESTALTQGLPPEGFEILLRVALSGKLADTVNTRLLKSLIPASVIPEDSVVKAVSWLCVGKCSDNIQLLFFKWLITVFDFIDRKEQLRALYSFFFFYLQDDRMGMQSHLQALLSLYKLYCPEKVTITLPGKMKKWNTQLVIPASSSNTNNLGEDRQKNSVSLYSTNEFFPVEQLQTFPQLLQNIHRLEFPSQMGSVLTNPLLLHYMNFVKDESIYLRLYYWMGQMLQEDLKSYIYDPLAQLFFTSSIYFKCSVLESLKELLQNWLNCNVIQVDLELSSLNTTLSGLVNAVAELVRFVGWISTVGLRLENNSSFLLYFILDFYGTVCDMYLKYNLPLLIMPPAGVFYPALLSMDSVNLNQLCYIMYRYRTNLVAAKENELTKKKMLQFKFSNQTYVEYNQYITAMVGCLWTSSAFQKDIHPQGLRMDDQLLSKTAVKELKNSFNIVYHPAMMGYSIQFLKQICPDETTFNFKLIKGKKWDCYLEYLYTQGFKGLKVFIESSISRVSQTSHRKAENVEP
ncbi:centromere protein I isoform X1 [Turdus rufiventris]|nr:centromere protein I isoform X1 [Turdus rufiventris]